jgi:hypothetical protein
MSEKIEHKEETNDNPEEELAVGDWKIIDLPEVDAKSGEEDEELLFRARTKLYRWREEWKERGVGDFSIFRNKETNKIRGVHRQEKTFKVRSHFFITGENLCQLKELKTSKNSYFWVCVDFSEDKPALERFAIRFRTPEECEEFNKVWTQSYENNSKLDWSKKTKENNDEKKEVEETKEGEN